MPTTLRERYCLSVPTGLQSQSELEQPAHTWSHGFWYQQQSEDDLSWMEMDECSGTDVDEINMDTKPSDPLACRTGYLTLTLPPIPGSVEWVNRRVGQCAPDGLPRSSTTLGDWGSSNFWNAPLFTGSHCSPSLFSPVHRFPRLPSFETDVGHQIDEPSTATSELFSAIPEENEKSSRLRKPFVHSPVMSVTSSDDIKQAPKPKPKRGRPRLVRDETLNSPTPGHRVPHNQVEQKYRNGLNAELERLRETVSTQMNYNTTSTVKLSKAMVLSGAIDCIKIMEAARDELEHENKGLKRYNKRLRREKKMTANE